MPPAPVGSLPCPRCRYWPRLGTTTAASRSRATCPASHVPELITSIYLRSRLHHHHPARPVDLASTPRLVGPLPSPRLLPAESLPALLPRRHLLSASGASPSRRQRSQPVPRAPRPPSLPRPLLLPRPVPAQRITPSPRPRSSRPGSSSRCPARHRSGTRHRRWPLPRGTADLPPPR